MSPETNGPRGLEWWSVRYSWWASDHLETGQKECETEDEAEELFAKVTADTRTIDAAIHHQTSYPTVSYVKPKAKT